MQCPQLSLVGRVSAGVALSEAATRHAGDSAWEAALREQLRDTAVSGDTCNVRKGWWKRPGREGNTLALRPGAGARVTGSEAPWMRPQRL